MAFSKAATLLERSRRKLRISVVMLMMPPTQECFVPLGQNDQWNFRTMLAVLRCEFLRERAASATRHSTKPLTRVSHLTFKEDRINLSPIILGVCEMQLDSARELKALCLRQRVRPIMARAAAAGALGVSARVVADVDAVQRTIALGIIPKGKNSFQLAVRVQTRALENGPEVEAIRKSARGEADIRYVGRIMKRAATPWYRCRQQPLLIGTSIGHYTITAGTLGCFVSKGDKEQPRILSNNHVLAAENQGRKGDAILQPGKHDKGQKNKDTAGALDSFIRLDEKGPNKVDCALATIREGVDIERGLLTGVGQITGTAALPPPDNARVHKIGRTTGLTNGVVAAFEVDNVIVSYELGNLRFDNQLEIEGTDSQKPFSLGGDSGSLIYDDERRAVALLFAGSDQGGKKGRGLTYANPIDSVFGELGVKLLY
jgi:hypothetical protein